METALELECFNGHVWLAPCTNVGNELNEVHDHRTLYCPICGLADLLAQAEGEGPLPVEEWQAALQEKDWRFVRGTWVPFMYLEILDPDYFYAQLA